MKRKLKLAFILDPYDKLYWSEDTSCTIMSESIKRGHEVYGIQMGTITARGRTLVARAERLSVTMETGVKILESIPALSLDQMDVIFIRKEPPFDAEYLYLTQLLELIEDRVFIINSPAGLRKFNEKLAVLHFPDLTPPLCVSANADELLFFQDAQKSAVVLKPLDQKGGTGITLLPLEDTNRKERFSSFTQNGKQTVMCQKFIPAVKKTGDVRVLLLDGKIIGAFSRIPKEDSFLANLDQGGQGVRHPLTAREKEIAERVGKALAEDGVYFIGIDIIGEHLSEINVTSPAGIFDINGIEHLKLESLVVDFLEKKAK